MSEKSKIQNPKSKIGIVILAAGESKRLNYFPKQLLKFHDKTLLRHTTENALNSNADLVCVVLGANADQLRSEIEDLSVEICVNENWAEGMASSLQTGLKKLLEIEPQLGAICITLCDQPLISSKIINQLILTFQNSSVPIVASEYAETVGVPAIFASQLFAQLLNLRSSEGAKKVIMKHPNSVVKITIPEAVYDIDSKEDFEHFLNKIKPRL